MSSTDNDNSLSQNLLDSFSTLEKLEFGWDGSDADPFDIKFLENLKNSLIKIRKHFPEPDKIYPGGNYDSRVALEWCGIQVDESQLTLHVFAIVRPGRKYGIHATVYARPFNDNTVANGPTLVFRGDGSPNYENVLIRMLNLDLSGLGLEPVPT